MGRVRTTKTLAQRIDLQYFTRSHPWRRWQFLLALLVPAAIFTGFVAQRTVAGQKVYSSGPLSLAHVAFTKNCALCHAPNGGAFRAHVEDKACLGCHDAPAHHQADAKFTPSCSSCHVEHKQSAHLAAVATTSCTECHAKLSTQNGATHYARSIAGFDDAHPEFAAVKNGSDPGGIKLSHFVHLRANLPGPQGTVQMACSDCHRAGAMQAQWPYAQLAQTPPTANGVEAPRVATTARDGERSRYMQPIRYSQQCAGCHERDLRFDSRPELANLSVPHDKPEVVHQFLVRQLTSYIAAHPGAVREVAPPDRNLPGNPRPSTLVARNASEWINLHVEQSELVLWKKGCKLCHTMAFQSGKSLPEVQPSAISQRWFLHAEFSHNSHQAVTCASCHAGIERSKFTSDVNLPSIAQCRTCHQEAGAKRDAADGRCSECHRYHNWGEERPAQSSFTIEQLRSKVGGEDTGSTALSLGR